MTSPPPQSFAVVPAAGRSVRMGQPKLMLQLGHTTILEQVLAVWQSAHVHHIVVVVHPNDQQLADVARSTGAHVVVPATPPPHMKDSVIAALKFIDGHLEPAPSDPWLLAPADVPKLSPRVISTLLKEHDPKNPAILVPCHGLRRGHPALIPWAFAHRVPLLNADEGINVLVEAGPTRLLEIGPDATPDDIDTPADLSRHLEAGS